jgi:hypothetical protein
MQRAAEQEAAEKQRRLDFEAWKLTSMREAAPCSDDEECAMSERGCDFSEFKRGEILEYAKQAGYVVKNDYGSIGCNTEELEAAFIKLRDLPPTSDLDEAERFFQENCNSELWIDAWGYARGRKDVIYDHERGVFYGANFHSQSTQTEAKEGLPKEAEKPHRREF